MPVDRRRVVELLEFYSKDETLSMEQYAYFRAICHVQLREYGLANAMFSSSLRGNLTWQTSLEGKIIDPIWWAAARADLLVDSCALSARIDLFSDVARGLCRYRRRTDRSGAWGLTDMYACGMMDVLMSTTGALAVSIEGMLKKPKVKDCYAMGLSLAAIVAHDEAALNTALVTLLEAHEGIAKDGSLRWSAEGLLSMSAMALAYAACRQGMHVAIANDYFSQGYLDYLLALEPGRAR